MLYTWHSPHTKTLSLLLWVWQYEEQTESTTPDKRPGFTFCFDDRVGGVTIARGVAEQHSVVVVETRSPNKRRTSPADCNTATTCEIMTQKKDDNVQAVTPKMLVLNFKRETCCEPNPNTADFKTEQQQQNKAGFQKVGHNDAS